MNKDQFAGQWKILKGQVKTKWGKLTDDEITQVNGKFEQLAGLLQKKYGLAKEKASQEIETWLQTVNVGSNPREQATHGQFNKGQQPDRTNTQSGQQPQRMFADQDPSSSRSGRGQQTGKGGFGQESGRNEPNKKGQQDRNQDFGKNKQNNR